MCRSALELLQRRLLESVCSRIGTNSRLLGHSLKPGPLLGNCIPAITCQPRHPTEPASDEQQSSMNIRPDGVLLVEGGRTAP